MAPLSLQAVAEGIEALVLDFPRGMVLAVIEEQAT